MSGKPTQRRKPYPAYKDSGVEWLGQVPEGWEVKQIRRVSSVLRGASPRPIDNPIYFSEDGEFAWVRIADVTASCTYLEETTQRLSDLGARLSIKLEPGELFLSIAGSVGKPCITAIKCCIHDGFVYFPNISINKKFLYYIFESGEPYKGLGKLGTQLNLNTDTVGSIRIAIPPYEQIEKLVIFLDLECARIDALIEKKRHLLEFLEEKRRVVITQAVTRGLDPNVSMKDSGVEWIGSIPKHWNKIALKFLVSVPITDGPHETPVFHSEGIPFVSAEAVSAGFIDFNKIRGFISEEDNQRFSKKYSPSLNDIYIVKSGATTGITAIVDCNEKFNIWSPLAAIRVKEDINPKFVLNFMRSANFQDSVVLNWSYGTQQNIGMNVIENLYCVIPPRHEQDTIVDYLDVKTKDIYAQKSDLYKSIALLQEYRASLITHAVTGKIDVREYCPEQ